MGVTQEIGMAKKVRNPKHPSGRVLAKPLARVGDPLVLPGGHVVQPTPAGGVYEKPQDVSPKKFKATKRRSLQEFPADPSVLNGIACVIFYTLLGVGDREIADAMKVSLPQVKDVRKHSVYSEAFEMMQEEFISVNSDRIQSRIAAYGFDAVEETGRLIKEGKFESTRLKASENIVNWGGHSKSESMKASGMEPLRVLVINGKDKTTEVSINMGG